MAATSTAASAQYPRTTAAKTRGIDAAFASLLGVFQVESDRPDLVQAQVKALSTRIPLLFFITVVNTLALAYSHYGAASDLMTVDFSAIITIAYAWRGWDWLQIGRREISDADAVRLLKLTAILGPACSAILNVWALALYRYGDAYTQGHIVFYLGVTLVSCAFCMMHLRSAAVLMTVVTVVPFAIFFLATGRSVFIAAVISMLLVSSAMIYIVVVFSRDFANMIEFQRGLVESQRQNARLANTDSLTDLPNRRQFLAELEAVFDRATRDGGIFVVGMIDLDGFKSVNDLYGHTAGDKLLVAAGRRMRGLCDQNTLIARLGGDEFGVLIEANLSEAEIHAVGDRICNALGAPFVLPEFEVEVAGTVGFASFPQAGSTAESLFERADYALCHAKQHRRGRPQIFSFEHETEIRELAKFEHCLRHADLRSETSMHFQPIVDVERGRTISFEALARWVSPILGPVAPDVFIRFAERTDLINKLTRTLLTRALSDAEAWPCDIRMSFNLSTRDLASRDAISSIIEIVENSRIAPNRIDFEVTETALIQDYDQAIASLRRLKSLGAGVSLDDFGTGYSSLSYMQRFPIDKIKIDRSFIRDVETKPSCRAIVKSVIDLCRSLKLGCIVEGMETDGQAQILRALGCTTMQGYLFGRPTPAAQVLGFLETANARRRVAASKIHAVAS